jgi:hypothetical protein
MKRSQSTVERRDAHIGPSSDATRASPNITQARAKARGKVAKLAARAAGDHPLFVQ